MPAGFYPRPAPIRIALLCALCGDEFHVKPSRVAKSRYCSKPCFDDARRIPPSERFWDKVQIRGECWEWTG